MTNILKEQDIPASMKKIMAARNQRNGVSVSVEYRDNQRTAVKVRVKGRGRLN